MLSQTSEYALRAAAYLARRQDPGYVGVREIAAATNIPVNYLAKILQRLVKARLLVSQKGFGGGFRVSGPLGKICMLDVVDAVENTTRLRHCVLGQHVCADDTPCPLHLSRITDAYLASLRRMTLQDLVDFFQKQPAARELVASAG